MDIRHWFEPGEELLQHRYLFRRRYVCSGVSWKGVADGVFERRPDPPEAAHPSIQMDLLGRDSEGDEGPFWTVGTTERALSARGSRHSCRPGLEDFGDVVPTNVRNCHTSRLPCRG